MARVPSCISGLLLLLAISTAVLAQDTPNTNPAVLDVAGQPLIPGTAYHVLPDSRYAGEASGGGLTLIDRYGNQSCPFYVGQENSSQSSGLPVIFTPFFESETVIHLQADFTAHFDAATTCVQTTTWALDEPASATGTVLLRTGTDPVYLRIVTEGDAYNLYYCPTTVCPLCRFDCGNVTVVTEGDNRLLALRGPSLPVVFSRA
ncbi:hypothetical protein ACLOJK_014321 [Asimina triloba]